MLLSLSKFNLSVFVPPLPLGSSYQSRGFGAHFATFVSVMSVVIDVGRGQTCEFSKVRRTFFQVGVAGNGAKRHSSMSPHNAELAARRDAVRKRAVDDANLDMKTTSSADSPTKPSLFASSMHSARWWLRRGKPCVRRGSCCCRRWWDAGGRRPSAVLRRMDIRIQGTTPPTNGRAGASNTKQQVSADANTSGQPNVARGWTTAADPTPAHEPSRFARSMAKRGTLDSVCAITWRGAKCERMNCSDDPKKRSTAYPTRRRATRQRDLHRPHRQHRRQP